jgi:hypothetical protein
MTRLLARLTAVEKATGISGHETPGTLEYHMLNGSDDPEAIACDKRSDPEHGPECVYKVAMKTNDGVRFMRIVGFDPSGLD